MLLLSPRRAWIQALTLGSITAQTLTTQGNFAALILAKLTPKKKLGKYGLVIGLVNHQATRLLFVVGITAAIIGDLYLGSKYAKETRDGIA